MNEWMIDAIRFWIVNESFPDGDVGRKSAIAFLKEYGYEIYN